MVDIPINELERLKHRLFVLSGVDIDLRGELQDGELPVGVGSFGHDLAARLDDGGSTTGYAILYRTAGEPAFGASVSDSFVRLTPHLAQALRLARRLAELECRARSSAQFTSCCLSAVSTLT